MEFGFGVLRKLYTMCLETGHGVFRSGGARSQSITEVSPNKRFQETIDR